MFHLNLYKAPGVTIGTIVRVVVPRWDKSVQGWDKTTIRKLLWGFGSPLWFVSTLSIFQETYHMIDRCDASIATWSSAGDNFVVKNVEKFASVSFGLGLGVGSCDSIRLTCMFSNVYPSLECAPTVL